MNNPDQEDRRMKIPEYITKKEVQRVCQELGIQDWSGLKEASIPMEEAETVLGALDVHTMPTEGSRERRDKPAWGRVWKRPT